MAINKTLFCMSSFRLEIWVKRSVIHFSSLHHLVNTEIRIILKFSVLKLTISYLCCSSPKVMSHDVFSNMFSPRQYLGEMLGRSLGVTQLYLVFGDFTGDWAFAVVAFISKDF